LSTSPASHLGVSCMIPSGEACTHLLARLQCLLVVAHLLPPPERRKQDPSSAGKLGDLSAVPQARQLRRRPPLAAPPFPDLRCCGGAPRPANWFQDVSDEVRKRHHARSK